MVKPALAAVRAVQVLDYLAFHPGHSFSLKELSGATGINAPSLLAVMAALTERGYVVRHPRHKTYTMGPGVVAIGQAAVVQHPTVVAARAELGVLAGELEAQCAASVMMGDELVALVTAGRPRRVATWTQPGTRVPFVAPFGAPYAAYGSDAVRHAWIQRSRRRAGDPRSEVLERALADLRARGFAAIEDRVAGEELARLLQALVDEPVDQDVRRRLDALLDELSDGFVDLDQSTPGVDVRSVTVPVFSPVGEVVMVLTAGGFAGPLTISELVGVGDRMRANAEVISATAFGSLGSAPKRWTATAE